MAISVSLLTNGLNQTPATSFATASITPGANRLVLATVLNVRLAGSPTVPTASGNSLTWVQVDTVLFDTIAAPIIRLTTFRALGTPTTGAITFDFGGVTQDDCAWTVSECTGVDTSGTNGSGAVVQSANNRVDAATVLTVTLGAFGSGANGAYSVFANGNNESTSPDSGWTELDDQSFMESQWRADNDTTASGTIASNGAIGGIALEIRASTLFPYPRWDQPPRPNSLIAR